MSKSIRSLETFLEKHHIPTNHVAFVAKILRRRFLQEQLNDDGYGIPPECMEETILEGLENFEEHDLLIPYCTEQLLQELSTHTLNLSNGDHRELSSTLHYLRDIIVARYSF